MPEIRPDPSDVKLDETYGVNNQEVGTFIGELSVEVNTGKIIYPLSDTESVIV